MSRLDVSNTSLEEIITDSENEIIDKKSSHSSKRFKHNETTIDCNHYWNQYYVTEDDVQYSHKDLQLFKRIESQHNLFRLITSSLCPQIYGHEMVKSALVLSLFCGTDKYDKENTEMTIRGQIHVLIFGDHGSNKDLLLKSVSAIANKSQYVCGNTSTINGLTASIVKHKNKQIFEKGSLVSADLGFCCIDEFDKMSGQQQQALQEVMEYQTVSIIKKCLVHNLNARTSIIAAANPISGAYDDSKNVWENIRANKSVISKFDLIFVLQDSPDDELDSKLSKDVLLSRRNDRSNATNSESSSKSSSKSMHSSDKSYLQSGSSNRNDCNLMSKLIYGPEEDEPDLIPHSLLQKYVSYAQKYIHPTISPQARSLLNKFSLQIDKSKISKSITRKLELLYRLVESRAKLELRNEATVEDAFDIIDIVKHSIDKQFIVSNICQPIYSMFGSSKKSKALNLIKALQIIAEQTQQNLFSVNDIIEICSQFKIPFEGKDDIILTIDKLNFETLLLKNGSNYKLNA